MDFVFDAFPLDYHHTVKLVDLEIQRVFYDKLTFVYIELPKFQKPLSELNTMEEKWLYTLRNMGSIEDIPSELCEPVFRNLFESAKICRLDENDLTKVAQTMIDEAARNDEIAYAIDKGQRLGIALGITKGIEEGLAKGLAKGHTEGLAKGLAKGIAEGKTEGKAEGATEAVKTIAKALKEAGVAFAVIAAATKLSEEEIKAL